MMLSYSVEHGTLGTLKSAIKIQAINIIFISIIIKPHTIVKFPYN